MHTNDRHGYIEAVTDHSTGERYGGIALEAAMIARLRRRAGCDGESLLLVDTGDIIQGTPVVSATKGSCMIDLYNRMGYDFVTFGNHEFDYGPAVLKGLLEKSRFTWISSNVTAPALDGLYERYAVLDLAGSRVAFLAVTTTTTPTITYPHATEGIDFLEPASILPRLMKSLERREGVKVFILLSHLGEPGDEWLARHVGGISLIIGAHSHSRLFEPVRVGDTWIVQAGCHGRYIGVVRVRLSAKGDVDGVEACLRPVSGDCCKPDRETAELVESYTSVLREKLEELVGTASCEIPRGGKWGDSPMGGICAEAARAAVGADFAFTNIGGVRAGLHRGPVTMRMLMLVSPFSNTIVKVRLCGSVVRSLLERSLEGFRSDGEQGDGAGAAGGAAAAAAGRRKLQERRAGFLVGSGIRYSFDLSRPPGDRLVRVTVGDEPLEDSRSYEIAVNSYLASGGDGFFEFAEAKDKVDTGILEVEALRRFFLERREVGLPERRSVVRLVEGKTNGDGSPSR